MKYEHMVKVRGQYYPAGVEIPELELDEELQNTQIGNQDEEQRSGDEDNEPEETPKEDGVDTEPAKQTAKRGRKPVVSQ